MDLHGFPLGEIEHGSLRIGYLRHGSLRLVRLCLAGGPRNLFAELPAEGWQTPHGFYRLIGGHRLWVAPERADLTYLPEPPEIEEQSTPNGVRLVQPVDVRSGLQRRLEISFQTGQTAFCLTHDLVNHGSRAVTVAAWAISQFPLGGIAALPQPHHRLDPDGYQANRSLAFWPYTRLNDPRLCWMEDHLMVDAQQLERPCKLGYFGLQGWCVYLLEGVLIRKQVHIRPDQVYPDMNSAIQIYLNHRFLELESTSSLVCLEPGEQISHQEFWNLESFSGVQDTQALAEYLTQQEETTS